jgi:hypothetical protein
LAQDVAFLGTRKNLGPDELPRLNALQSRMDGNPEAYLRALMEAYPQVRASRRQSKEEMLNLILQLARTEEQKEWVRRFLSEELERTPASDLRTTLEAASASLGADR